MARAIPSCMNADTNSSPLGILIVYDNGFVGRNLQHVIQKLGFWSVATRSPLQATKILRKHRHQIVGALFAIQPNRLIGPRLIRELRAVNPGLALGFVDLLGQRGAMDYLRTQGDILARPLLPSLRSFLATLTRYPPGSQMQVQEKRA